MGRSRKTSSASRNHETRGKTSSYTCTEGLKLILLEKHGQSKALFEVFDGEFSVSVARLMPQRPVSLPSLVEVARYWVGEGIIPSFVSFILVCGSTPRTAWHAVTQHVGRPTVLFECFVSFKIGKQT